MVVGDPHPGPHEWDVPGMSAQGHEPGIEPFVSMNTFTPGPHGVAAVVDFQLAEMAEMDASARAAGWLGNLVFLAHEPEELLVVTAFASPAARDAWSATTRFQRHVDELAPLVDQVTSRRVRLLARHGAWPAAPA